uniref:NADH dehydrogenase subunit 6 n=1 Tax=Ochetellus glaber TaxID=255795 RepID=A0A6B9BLF6_9HYME|nr:NADH dehydrogenase subunit 6 [Ochetellus glaber]QGW36346.1 NADH dehydrogenase subunit 6 [Ochetellus glaber]
MMKFNSLFLITMMMIIMMLMLIPKNNLLHPILIMSMIIMYSVLMSMNMSIWKMNYMYSIMLFLIMISGLLIIFLYFSSLISNEKMNLSLNFNIISIITMNFILIMLNILYKKLYNYNMIFKTKDNMSIMEVNNKSFQNILNLYTYPFNNLTILCMSFLLISLFSIIKISSLKSKPLRKIIN